MPELSQDVMHKVFRAALEGSIKIRFDSALMAKRGRKRLLDFRRLLKDNAARASYYDVVVSKDTLTVTLHKKVPDQIVAQINKALRGHK